ncbi:PcfJ domain-containing protein [Empedobacter falsenii]|uniref:PcfJ domain-containing protein n=1 Tax=Empedobacter falsenii TaxID=343874 RepID=UPI00257869EF|nr:PcfJ domain-containing protein [Empedobacter falsenii]MDM1548603.1 PcfJ domain-containing protein [Empedobacter falsenii]
MKPRTKAQIEVLNLSKLVLDVENRVKNWAHKECNEHVGLATKKNFWCIDCGDEHPVSLVKNNKVTCPSCKSKLTIEKSLKRKYHQNYNVAFAEVLGDYQVIRIFEISSYHRKHEKPTIYARENIMQFIPSDHRKVQYVARTTYMGYEPRHGQLEIRKPHAWKPNVYNPLPYKYHPWSTFKEEFTKLGIDSNLQGLTILTLIDELIYSQAETLLKAKQYKLLNYFGAQNHSKIITHWASVKIAIRNKYFPKDASIWLDYLDLLEQFGKDLRSPKYLFPDNLEKAHDKLVEKRRAIQNKLELEKRKKDLENDEKKYSEKIQKFLGLEFSKGDLKIKVLESVKEFIEEGDAHKHCVFTNKYYNKEDSLLFSATYKGVRIETVEVSIKNLEVLQSRGLQNKASDQNKSILKLIEDNLYQIENRINKLQKTA